MGFDIEKCAMLTMESGKRETAGGQNHQTWKALECSERRKITSIWENWKRRRRGKMK